MKTQFKLLAIASLVCVAQGASAQAAGDWLVRAGAVNITPQVTSGNLSAPSYNNTKSDVGADTQPAMGITYMLTDNFSLDLPVALPFKHTLYGADGIAGVGKIGEVKALPVTLFAQYRFFEPKSMFRPYVGLAPTYAYFFDESGSAALTAMTNPGGTPTTLKVDSKWTYTVQIGATVSFNKNWFGDVFYSQTPLKTTTTLSTGQTQDVTLDPVSYGVSIGYKF